MEKAIEAEIWLQLMGSTALLPAEGPETLGPRAKWADISIRVPHAPILVAHRRHTNTYALYIHGKKQADWAIQLLCTSMLKGIT